MDEDDEDNSKVKSLKDVNIHVSTIHILNEYIHKIIVHLPVYKQLETICTDQILRKRAADLLYWEPLYLIPYPQGENYLLYTEMLFYPL